jgi:xanthine dehydrogenase YagR molybdenum-binding subunit
VSTTATRSVGESLERLAARAKVTGQAKYAYESAPGELSYGLIVQSSIARGTVRSVDASRALSLPDVRTVLWPGNAPALAEGATGELAVLQSPEVAYRGQIVAIVVADSPETAQQAAQLLAIEYDEDAHDVQLRLDHPGLYKPDKVNPTDETDTERGDFDDAYATAPVTVDQTYATPAEHNNPIELHATIAVWKGDGVTVYDSNQGSSMAGQTIAEAFGLSDDQVHIIAHHVGGGFGSKGMPRPTAIAAVMAARAAGRAVKLAATRQQMTALTGYRTPTIQRVRIGAHADGTLIAINHEAFEQSSTWSSATTSTTTSRDTTSPPARTSRAWRRSRCPRTTRASTRWAPRASARSAS